MKRIFTAMYVCAAAASAVIAVYKLALLSGLVWIGVLLTATPPLVNRYWHFDHVVPANYKVRLPLVSALVLIGLGLTLLTIPARGPALYLALACTGGFLLQTYWAEDSPGLMEK